jgi:hypothetical protein
MSPQSGRLIAAFSIAAVLAFVAIVPSVFGIETWKILLALFGLVLTSLAGPASRTGK